uniref:Uncharacterized protein n=1 Tax=Leersia perrieri TaxID=77586 RepID=A0A0D9VXQ2_9ORYZ
MVSISMYRGNLHRAGADADHRWPAPAPTITAARFRRLLRGRSLSLARVEGAGRADSAGSSSTSRLADGDAAGEEGADHEEEHEEGEEGEQDGEEGEQEGEEGEEDEQQPEEAGEEQEEGPVVDADMDDAGEVLVGGEDADGNGDAGDAQEGQGESEGFDPDPEGSCIDGIEERKRELNDKLDTLNKKKHDLVQMLKQILNAEEEIRMRTMQASLRTAMPQPSENAADGSSVSRLVPRMTVDVNFSDVAGESEAGSNQGTPGRPLHHVHSISPSTASFARSPFGSLQHNSGHTPRSPFSTASPSRFAAAGHQGHPTGHPTISLPGVNFVASSPSPAASGGSSSVFRDYRPPNST